jgi:hypothetical protein
MAAFEHYTPIRGALATVGHAEHRKGLAGRRPAAQRGGVPAVAVQRPRSPWAQGQFAAVIVLCLDRSGRRTEKGRRLDQDLRRDWTMPALERLAPLRLTLTTKVWPMALRGFVILAGGSVVVRPGTMAWKGLVA